MSPADLTETIAESPWACVERARDIRRRHSAAAFIIVWVFKLVTQRLGARGPARRGLRRDE